jgi:putative addiction module component (TIGR02574 family)
MTQHAKFPELAQLPVADRLQILEEVWDSLTAAPEAIQVPDWHKTELDRRLESLASEPGTGRSWSEVKTEILARLQK